MDPVFVYYPRDFCSSNQIALEVWKRDERRWVEHPRHPVVPVDSCQLEDAGILLNEIRWRCFDLDGSDPEFGWSVGVRVFEPGVMQHCDVARTGSGFGETEIHISNPRPDETISDADGNLEIDGSVWIGGLAGAEYDIVIAIDTSAAKSTRETGPSHANTQSVQALLPHASPDPLTAQVRAAHAFVESIRNRLGEIRVGIVSFPGVDAKSASTPDVASSAASEGNPDIPLARRELALTDNAVELQRALQRVLDRDRAGPNGFTDGLALAIDELYRPPGWPGAARPGARRIVMLSADGSGGVPFGPSAQADRDFRERNVERARNASARGVALHLFALSGISEEPPPFINEMLANPASSFTRVPSPERGAFFADHVSLPYLEKLSIHDPETGQSIGYSSFSADGKFAASVPLSPGSNRLTIRARTSDGDEHESTLAVDFDESAYKDRLLA
ncbi:MAG: VWA domain-containing protein, partial [Deltaproteobacteria bacterium]|nr:VWA domain-containing protein [Deltaproteobacteria bacterium]